MVKNVSKEEIEKWIGVINSLHYTASGYRNDLRSLGTMEQIIYEALRKEDGKYNTKEKMATYFLYEIAIKHPFWDGNKRTALITGLFIILKDMDKVKKIFPCDWSDMTNVWVRFMLDVAMEKYSYDEVLERIKEMFKCVGD